MSKDPRANVPIVVYADIAASLDDLSVNKDTRLPSAAARNAENPSTGHIQLDGSRLPDLSYLWPLPFWAAGYWMHTRFRAWRPRRLPPFAHLTLRQLYGTLALGHCADAAADGMQARLKRVWDDDRACGRMGDEYECDAQDDGERARDADRAYIEKWSWVLLRSRNQEFLKTVRESTQWMIPGPELDLSLLEARDEFSLSNPASSARRWIQEMFFMTRFSHLWSTAASRAVVTVGVTESCHQHGLSAHDTSILTVFLAERLTIGESYICAHHPALQGYLPWLVGFIGTANIFVLRGRIPTSFFGSAMLQWHKIWLSALAYRLFAARYHHYAELWKLEDPEKAAEALRVWLRREKEQRESK